MSLPDLIEFHLDARVLVEVESSHAPDFGELVNSRRAKYRVIRRTDTVDHSDGPRQRQMVCIINLAKESPSDDR